MLKTKINAMLIDEDLSKMEKLVLIYFAMNADDNNNLKIMQSDISKELSMSRATIVTAIKGLSEKKLIKYKHSGTGGCNMTYIYTINLNKYN